MPEHHHENHWGGLRGHVPGALSAAEKLLNVTLHGVENFPGEQVKKETGEEGGRETSGHMTRHSVGDYSTQTADGEFKLILCTLTNPL